MCGICGIFHYRDGRPVDERLVGEMTEAITHRGPDDDGLFCDAGVGMGMRRLSIIDLEGGAQPIGSEDDRIVTVFNGEIYNFRELRRELESFGHVFRTRTDTETIVHGHEQWGFDGLARLNGMFGIALWDRREHRLIIARDPYGIKPLYYHDDGSSLRFGSEIKSILCDDGVPRDVDREALDAFLTLTYIPSPATAFAGICKVPPGFALVCDAAGCRLRRFHFAAPRLISVQRRDEHQLVGRLQDLIEKAVRRQMVADVPVGALLSGGVDSTAIATIMTGLADQPIDTFTVGFGGDYALDETHFARETARRIGSRHHDVMVSADEFAAFLPLSVWHLEELVSMDSTLAYYKVCELARHSVKVVLTGQGADEPFAGYPRHIGERYGGFMRLLPAHVQARVLSPLIERLPRTEQLKRAVRSLGIADVAERRAAIWTIMDADFRHRLYCDDWEPRDELRAGGLWEPDVEGLDGLSQMLYLDSRLSLADNLLMYGDKMSMAVSLEARVPFLDLELMHLVESIPPRLKIHGLTRKYVLKRALAKWVPGEVIQRKKIGFRPPVDQWLRTDLRSHVADLLLARDSGCMKYFDHATVRSMIDDHAGGRQDYKRALLSLLVFELWHGQFVSPSSSALRKAIHDGRPASEGVVA
jgi:asparagine synthase (glutamine-hydrolysing)